MLMRFVLIALVSAALTAAMRHYALSHKVLDMPNQRSSHAVPTPRGGGLAMVLAFALALMFIAPLLSQPAMLALAASALVAGIGFWDDHAPLAARWRLLCHVVAAVWVWWAVGDAVLTALLTGIGLESAPDALWGLGAVGMVFAVVWLLNLFNFMDGTDGIAASQALFVSGVLAIWLAPLDAGLSAAAWGLAAAALGFLVWNWPKASIFMGDVGSGFLGFVLAVLLLLASQRQPLLMVCGLMIMALFVVDASVTLLVRLFSGQAWTQAHCSHSYQRLAKRYGHLRLLLLCWAINVGYLLPLAVGVLHHGLSPILGLMLAYLPLVALAFYCKAGQVELTS